MSEMYGFGVDDDGQGEPQAPAGAAPKWFRERMDKVSEQLKALQERNEQLEQAQRQTRVAEALTAKGYAPQAAGLYTGTPDKLDDWLGTYGAGLAKAGGEAAGEAGQGVQGTPQSVIPAESQAALTAFSAAGTDGAGALTGEDALVARMNATEDDEAAFRKLMREQGNRYF